MRKSGIAGALIAALLATFAAMPASAAASAAPSVRDLDSARVALTAPGMGTVSVSVTAWGSAAWLNGGCVTLTPVGSTTESASQCSGSAGRYIVEDVPPGDYYVRAYRFTGRAPVYFGPAASLATATPVAVAADGTVSVTIGLPPSNTYLHRVLDGHGQPVVGITVTTHTTSPTSPQATATTDASGWVAVSATNCTSSCRMRYGDNGQISTSWYPGVATYQDSTTFSLGNVGVAVLPTATLDYGVGAITATIERPTYVPEIGVPCLRLYYTTSYYVLDEQCGAVGDSVEFDRVGAGGYFLCYGVQGQAPIAGDRDCLADGIFKRTITVLADQTTSVPPGFGGTYLALRMQIGLSYSAPTLTSGCVVLENVATLATTEPLCEATDGLYIFEVPPDDAAYNVEWYGFDGAKDGQHTEYTAPGEAVSPLVAMQDWEYLDVLVRAPLGSNATEVCAAVYSPTGELVQDACTPSTPGADTRVHFELPPDIYRVRAYSDDPGVTSVWHGGYNFENATDVNVRSQFQTVPREGSSLVLAFGAQASGTVVDSDGDPVDGACVEILAASGPYVTRACADSTGSWVVPGLQAGQYVLHVPATADFPSQWVGGDDLDTATAWDLAAGDAAVIDIVLTDATSVEGVVTGPAGVPATNGCVTAYASLSVIPVAVTCDDAGGVFALHLLPGDYMLNFHGWQTEDGSPLADTWSGSALTVDEAAEVAVGPDGLLEAGLELEEVGGTLTLHPIVTNRYDSREYAATAGCVDVYDSDGWFATNSCTGADGSVKLHLPSGDYRLFASGFFFNPTAQELSLGGDFGLMRAGDSWNGGSVLFSEAEVTTVAPDVDTEAELHLEVGGGLRGVVQYRPAGQPRVERGWVVAFDKATGYEVARTRITPLGEYQFSTIPYGAKLVFGTMDVPGAADQYYYASDPARVLLPDHAFYKEFLGSSISTESIEVTQNTSIGGRFLVPPYFAAGEVCAELYYPSTYAAGEILEEYFLDSRCGSAGSDFVFEDFPAGPYKIAFRDTEGYAEWYGSSRYWSADQADVLEQFLIAPILTTSYVQGAPVTLSLKASPRVTTTLSGLSFLRYSDGETAFVSIPVHMVNGDGTVTFTPPAPGYYYASFPRSAPGAGGGTGSVESNWIWIGPVIPEISMDGPAEGVFGFPITLDVTADPARSGTAYMWILRWGREWERSTRTIAITNGTGSFPTTVSDVKTQYIVEYLGVYSEPFEVTEVPHTLTLTGPTEGSVGTLLPFRVEFGAPVNVQAQLLATTTEGHWYNTGRFVEVRNGVGDFTITTPAVRQSFKLAYTGQFSNVIEVTPRVPAVSRVGGASRYDVAVGISQQYFPDGADTVYIATGANFPDALGAAPAAALRDAPLLLVPGTSIPQSIQDELDRLDPDTIIVTGGPASVSDGVLAQLEEYAATVTRISGPDRYEVSRRVTRDAFAGENPSIAYVATGVTFPDALSASAAAGSLDAPVILVYGKATTLDDATADLLEDLGVTEVRIAGGPASVSPGIEAALRNVPGVTTVTRTGGADRFVVSGATNRAVFSSSDTVFIASGMNFPDALSGAAVAGKIGAPLYVIPGTCIPGYVLDDIASFGATKVQIFGGPASVTPAAAAFARC